MKVESYKNRPNVLPLNRATFAPTTLIPESSNFNSIPNTQK